MITYHTADERLISIARLEEMEAEIERLRTALRPIAECFENQEKTDELIADFGYYAKQVARVYYREEIERAGQQAARFLEKSSP